jgi:hypothetical protein
VAGAQQGESVAARITGLSDNVLIGDRLAT